MREFLNEDVNSIRVQIGVHFCCVARGKSKKTPGITVIFDAKPPEDILNCLRGYFTWHGPSQGWRSADTITAERALRKLAEVLATRSWK